jgi:hypothetical protein
LPMKHWFNNLGWDIEEIMHDVILHYMKKVIRESLFLVSFKMKSWLLIMNLGFSFTVMLLKIDKIYLFHWTWKGSPKVLQIQISIVNVKTMMVQGGLIKVDIRYKLVFIGTNGGFVYVGCRLLFECN